MAAGMLAKPGSKYGPCKGECDRKDCAITRQQADSLCPACGKIIGYEKSFYRIDNVMVHAVCAESVSPDTLQSLAKAFSK